jgi:hypothetical protein
MGVAALTSASMIQLHLKYLGVGNNSSTAWLQAEISASFHSSAQQQEQD